MSFASSRARKRFWTGVDVVAAEGGFAIALDGRAIKTPAKVPLIVPTRALADLVAAEWRAQGDRIDPETMPATRGANAALDKVRVQFDAVVDILVGYGGSDLLCYRAADPAGLVARQAAGWDPLLDWATQRFGVRFVVTRGVMPVAQPAETLACLHRHVARFGPFQLTAFHDLVALPGSLVIALAVTEGFAAPHPLWQASRIDEQWQLEHWGEDTETLILADRRRQAFLHAVRFFDACARDCT